MPPFTLFRLKKNAEICESVEKKRASSGFCAIVFIRQNRAERLRVLEFPNKFQGLKR